MSILNALLPYGMTALPLVGGFSVPFIFKTQSHVKTWYAVSWCLFLLIILKKKNLKILINFTPKRHWKSQVLRHQIGKFQDKSIYIKIMNLLLIELYLKGYSDRFGQVCISQWVMHLTWCTEMVSARPEVLLLVSTQVNWLLIGLGLPYSLDIII